MIAKALAVYGCLMCFAVTPAMASETWDCKFRDIDGPPGVLMGAIVRINGKELDWEIQVPVIDGNGNPVQNVNGQVQTKIVTFRYRITENSQIRIATGVARAGQKIKGPSINKLNGILDMGDRIKDGKCILEK